MIDDILQVPDPFTWMKIAHDHKTAESKKRYLWNKKILKITEQIKVKM